MAESPSPELQQKIQRFQALGQQLQSLAQQRSQMELMRGESKRAKEALDAAAADAPVYRALGNLLVRDDRAQALERLDDELETLEIRVKRLKDQEAGLQEDLQGLQEELQKALGAS